MDKDAANAGFRHVLHMGMGGSSLTPLVFERIFPPAGDALPLTVLDSTDHATILKIENALPIADTLSLLPANQVPPPSHWLLPIISTRW